MNSVRPLRRRPRQSRPASSPTERQSEGQTLSVLGKVILTREATVPFPEIAAAFVTQHGSEYDRPITNRWIGGVLRRSQASLYKSNGIFVLSPHQQTRVD